MNRKRGLIYGVLVMLFALVPGITGCGQVSQGLSSGSTAATMEAPAVEAEDERAVAVATEEPIALAVLTEVPPAAAVSDGQMVPDTSTYRPNRLIIKNGEMQLLVADTDRSLDLATQVVSDLGGYIISSRVWYQDWLGQNYKYATMTVGIPVDQFETALRRFRKLAVRVVDESASGQDVTDEYVDLKSRLTNLEATRERIRQFLAQAQTVEEALKVNEQLAQVEQEIEQVQGRMNYLFDRSSFSTVTLTFNPELPPAPTLVPVPTPTPTPGWSPTHTAQQAGNTLGELLKGITDVAIWVLILSGPFLVPVLLIFWLVKRRPRS